MKFTHTPTILGLTGANGAGKDTVAAMLAAELHKHGHAPAVIAFADALSEEVSAAFNISVQALRATGTSHIIITDVRFADEAQAIRAQGGQIWRVHRPNFMPSATGHVSEVTGEEFAPESTILNCGSLDALRFSACQTLYRSSLRKPYSGHATQVSP